MVDSTTVLARLARALGIPVETFTQPETASDEQNDHLIENAELLEAWARIEDRQARRRCLSYIKSAAERDRRR